MSLDQISNSDQQKLGESKSELSDQKLDVHVVILNNYVRAHHVECYRALAARVRKLTVLLSVPMEPDREWDAQWQDLDVRVQKNWMFTTKWKHPLGFQEPNFIHVPIDTSAQLKQLNPDIVFSYEMGMRTLFSSAYRKKHPGVPLVMVGNMSDHVEKERGFLRRMLRKLICKRVDYLTYNGPSCKRYLESLNVSEDRLFHFPYCIDPNTVYSGPRKLPSESVRRLLYCGAISERKGVLQFADALKKWSLKNPDTKIEFSIAGSGVLKDAVAARESESLDINFLGNCDTAQLREAYETTDICVFPTLADEWGLVPIEAMASGVPVIGSVLAQSVESVVQDGFNGWSYDPRHAPSLMSAIESALACSPERLLVMGQNSRKSVKHISGATSAEKLCEIVEKVLPTKACSSP